MRSKAQRQRGWLMPDEITGHPTICVQFEIPNTPEYRAATRGAIYELTRRWNWDWAGPGDYRTRDVAQIFRELIDSTLSFNDQCGGAPEDSGCVDIPLSHPAIEWAPNDPFRTPDLIPGGYAFPPWYKANSITGITLGTSLGDIVTDITRTQSIPVIPPSSGYPRFRISVQGEGVIRLRFVQLNAGGYVQITTDDDIFTLEIFALNKDVISIPPETTDDVIIEREIKGEGAHHIDVLFIPRVNDELLPPVTQGGAIREVTLCGFDEMFQPCPDCPDPDPCPDCPDPDDVVDDWIDELMPGSDSEDLEMLLDCYKHAVGDIKMHVEPSAGPGWLLCDGASYEIAQFPELYNLLVGKTDSTETTFAVPDFSLRSPMGVGYDDAIGTVQSLTQRGTLAHNLTEAEMPAHSHQVEDHAHEVGGHVHPLNPDQHGHGIPEHNHSIPAHTHLLSNPTHSHDIEVRENSAIGAGQRLLTSSGAGVASTRSTLPFGPVSIQPTAPTNTGNWSGNTSSITIQVDQNEPFDSGMASPNTNSVGGGEAHPNVHPVLGVYFFIFAGCAMSSEDCL